MTSAEMEPVVKVNATSNIERFFIEQKQKCDGLMTECKSINVTNVFYIHFLFFPIPRIKRKQ